MLDSKKVMEAQSHGTFLAIRSAMNSPGKQKQHPTVHVPGKAECDRYEDGDRSSTDIGLASVLDSVRGQNHEPYDPLFRAAQQVTVVSEFD